MRALGTLALAAFLFAGCGGVYSTHPASDEATSRHDDRIVGFWRVVAEPEAGGPANDPRDETIFVVGRGSPSGPNLRVVTVTLHGDETIATSDLGGLTTTIGGKDHASVRPTPGAPGSGEVSDWVVLRYEMPDGDTLRVFGMDETSVAEDVRAKRVSGEVAEWTQAPGADSKMAVTLDGSTAALRAYIEARGDAVYRADRPLVLRRVKLP